MPTPPRHTRATSVAATKEAEQPSRRTRAASVSANKRPETPRKADVRSGNESDQTPTITQEEKYQRHQEEKKEFKKTARLVLAGLMSEDLTAELLRMHERIVQAEENFERTKDVGHELTEIGWRLEAEKTAHQLAKEEAPKKDPQSRVKGAYLDTTAQGYERAPLSARQHRTQQKLISEEKEKAGKVLEDLQEELVKGFELRADGGTNIAEINRQHDFRFQLWIFEGEYKDLQKESEDLEKIKSFISKVDNLIQMLRMTKNGAGDTLLPDGDFHMNIAHAEIMPDSMESTHAEIAAAHAPSTARKLLATEDKPKKTPRRKSIRIGALPIFTPNGTRANSEAVGDIPFSPLSRPPHISEAPAMDEDGRALRAPETTSWAGHASL